MSNKTSRLGAILGISMLIISSGCSKKEIPEKIGSTRNLVENSGKVDYLSLRRENLLSEISIYEEIFENNEYPFDVRERARLMCCLLKKDFRMTYSDEYSK